MSDRISYTWVEGLVKRQAQSEREMLEQFAAGDFTLDKPLVKRNPYLVNPLSAVVLFRTEEESAVTVTVFGKETRGNIVHTFPRSREHVLPILGLYPDW